LRESTSNYGINLYFMFKSKKKGWRKWFGYFTNVLLLLLILTLLIPSWRNSFQTWFSQLTLSDVEFVVAGKEAMPDNQKNWGLVNMNNELLNFAELEGKPIVLNFWATWCPSCKASFPDLGELRKNFRDDVIFIAVTTESVEVVHQSGIDEDFDFLYSAQAYPDFFQVKVYPTVVIMDHQMNLVYRLEGAADLNNEENITFLNGLVQKP
jgi:thiol-disulfide isomerase/thioredoxin